MKKEIEDAAARALAAIDDMVVAVIRDGGCGRFSDAGRIVAIGHQLSTATTHRVADFNAQHNRVMQAGGFNDNALGQPYLPVVRIAPLAALGGQDAPDAGMVNAGPMGAWVGMDDGVRGPMDQQAMLRNLMLLVGPLAQAKVEHAGVKVAAEEVAELVNLTKLETEDPELRQVVADRIAVLRNRLATRNKEGTNDEPTMVSPNDARGHSPDGDELDDDGAPSVRADADRGEGHDSAAGPCALDAVAAQAVG